MMQRIITNKKRMMLKEIKENQEELDQASTMEEREKKKYAEKGMMT